MKGGTSMPMKADPPVGDGEMAAWGTDVDTPEECSSLMDTGVGPLAQHARAL